jgi:hypothetical protein
VSLPEPLVVTLRVAHACERLGLRYLIGGSLASSYHGVPRSTNDADLLVELPGRCVAELVADLAADFYVDADMIEDAIVRGSCFNVIHLATMFKVDVFVLTRDELLLQEMARREQHALAEGSDERAWFATAEDTILQKLEWYRRGQGISDRQWRDVIGVFEVQGPSLDVAYLRRWAAYLRLEELLARAMAEAGVPLDSREPRTG